MEIINDYTKDGLRLQRKRTIYGRYYYELDKYHKKVGIQ